MKKGRLQQEGYIPRLIDSELSRRLDNIGAVEVAGTMWCGKTWTSLAYGESITRIGHQSTRIAAEADPGIALLGDKPHVIDEWQDGREPHNSRYASVSHPFKDFYPSFCVAHIRLDQRTQPVIICGKSHLYHAFGIFIDLI